MYKLYNGDCLEKLKEILSESIDMVIIDPPYKLTSGGTSGLMKGGIFDKKVYNNDGNLFASIPKFKDYMGLLYRVLKNESHCYIMINDKNLNQCLNEALNTGFRLHNILIWDKGNYTPNRWYMKNCEFILFLYKGKAKPIKYKGSKQLEKVKNKIGNRFHPTEKPVELIKKYIENSTNENDIILDCFMGSGSTGVACMNTNRKFIGIELDKNYFDIASKRIEEAFLNAQNKEGALNE